MGLAGLDWDGEGLGKYGGGKASGVERVGARRRPAKTEARGSWRGVKTPEATSSLRDRTRLPRFWRLNFLVKMIATPVSAHYIYSCL